MRWYEANAGYASSGQGSSFGLRDDVNLLTVEPAPAGTLLTWDEYFHAEDVPAMRTSFDEALADIAERLVARFGGRLLERYAGDGSTAAPSGPERTVGLLAEAINRGDLDAAAALYEPEAVLVAQPGQVANDRDGILQAPSPGVQMPPQYVSVSSSR